MNAFDGDGFSVYTERNSGKNRDRCIVIVGAYLWYGVRAPEIYEYGKGKNSRTRDSGNCRRDALTVGKQNFMEILRSPIPITVSRVEGQDAAGRRLFNLY